jgi:DNA-binding CsgD family transcriptional regulator
MVSFSTSQSLSKISVLCGFDFLGESIADSLELRSIATFLTHPLTLIFDADWGFALTAPIDPNRTSVIITDNPCPEYWEDLWDRKPTVLIAGRNFNVNHLLNFAQKADETFGKGKRFKETPYYQSSLSKAERKVFWWAVQNEVFSNEEIAKHTFLSVQTVSNHLRSIYCKLGVMGRTQLVLYYRHGDKGKSELQTSSQLLKRSVFDHQAN